MASGVFAVWKPRGINSAHVVRRIKDVLGGLTKVGHGGTLDRDAEGVLVIGVGKGTKMLSQFLQGSKEYTVKGMFGRITDSFECGANILEERDVGLLNEQDVKSSLDQFRGSVEQIPPAYSALKIGGKRMSYLMATGKLSEEHLKSKTRKVYVYDLELLWYDSPYFALKVRCGSGFYVRSLVHDIGLALGPGACVCSLIRTMQGDFGIDDALREDQWTKEDIQKDLRI